MPSVEDGVREFGLAFDLTDSTEETLRAAGTTAAFLEILRGLPAVLIVTSDPPGADVSVDGDSRGQTPLTLEDLTAGERQITLNLDGFLENNQTMRLNAGRTEAIDATLTPFVATQPVSETEAGESGQGGGNALKFILPVVGGVGAVAAFDAGGWRRKPRAAYDHGAAYDYGAASSHSSDM